MSNRTLIYATVLVVASMLVLLGLNLSSILTGEPTTPRYLHRNQIRGMAVGHRQLLYTLNFAQQNQIVDLLNEAIQVEGIPSGNREAPDIDALVVYTFDDKPEVKLQPIAYIDHNLLFSAPAWTSSGYLMERSEGDLQKLLSLAYDTP